LRIGLQNNPINSGYPNIYLGRVGRVTRVPRRPRTATPPSRRSWLFRVIQYALVIQTEELNRLLLEIYDVFFGPLTLIKIDKSLVLFNYLHQ
jgi:hypothetical protein